MSDCGCKVEGHTNIEIHDPRFSPSRIPDALTGRDGIAPVELFPGVWVKIDYCPKHAAVDDLVKALKRLLSLDALRHCRRSEHPAVLMAEAALAQAGALDEPEASKGEANSEDRCICGHLKKNHWNGRPLDWTHCGISDCRCRLFQSAQAPKLHGEFVVIDRDAEGNTTFNEEPRERPKRSRRDNETH